MPSMWTTFSQSLLMDQYDASGRSGRSGRSGSRGSYSDYQNSPLQNPVLQHLYSSLLKEVTRYKTAQDKLGSAERMGELKNAIKFYEATSDHVLDAAEIQGKNGRKLAEVRVSHMNKMLEVSTQRARDVSGKTDALFLRAQAQGGPTIDAKMGYLFGYILDTPEGDISRVKGPALDGMLRTAFTEWGVADIEGDTFEWKEGVALNDDTRAEARRAWDLAQVNRAQGMRLNDDLEKSQAAMAEIDEQLNALSDEADVPPELQNAMMQQMSNVHGVITKLSGSDEEMTRASLEKLQAADAHYKRVFEDFEKASDAMFGQDAGKLAKRGQAIGDPAFREWAADNGFHIGRADEGGGNYAPAKDDYHALVAFQRQMSRPPDARMRMRHTDEMVKITLPPPKDGDYSGYLVKEGPGQGKYAFVTVDGVARMVKPENLEAVFGDAANIGVPELYATYKEDGTPKLVSEGERIWEAQKDGSFEPLAQEDIPAGRAALAHFKSKGAYLPMRVNDGNGDPLRYATFEDIIGGGATVAENFGPADEDAMAKMTEGMPLIEFRDKPDTEQGGVVFGQRMRSNGRQIMDLGPQAITVKMGPGKFATVVNPTHVEEVGRGSGHVGDYLRGGHSTAARVKTVAGEAPASLGSEDLGTLFGVPYTSTWKARENAASLARRADVAKLDDREWGFRAEQRAKLRAHQQAGPPPADVTRGEEGTIADALETLRAQAVAHPDDEQIAAEIVRLEALLAKTQDETQVARDDARTSRGKAVDAAQTEAVAVQEDVAAAEQTRQDVAPDIMYGPDLAVTHAEEAVEKAQAAKEKDSTWRTRQGVRAAGRGLSRAERWQRQAADELVEREEANANTAGKARASSLAAAARGTKPRFRPDEASPPHTKAEARAARRHARGVDQGEQLPPELPITAALTGGVGAGPGNGEAKDVAGAGAKNLEDRVSDTGTEPVGFAVEQTETAVAQVQADAVARAERLKKQQLADKAAALVASVQETAAQRDETTAEVEGADEEEDAPTGSSEKNKILWGWGGKNRKKRKKRTQDATADTTVEGEL